MELTNKMIDTMNGLYEKQAAARGYKIDLRLDQFLGELCIMRGGVRVAKVKEINELVQCLAVMKSALAKYDLNPYD